MWFFFENIKKNKEILCLILWAMFNPSYIYEWRQFIPKLFLQNNLWKRNFSGYVKKKYDFCTKNDNSKYLQNTKKIFTPWKNSKS